MVVFASREDFSIVAYHRETFDIALPFFFLGFGIHRFNLSPDVGINGSVVAYPGNSLDVIHIHLPQVFSGFGIQGA